MAIRGKKKRTLEQIKEDEIKKQLSEKDNKEKGKTTTKKSHEVCDKCTVGCKPCRNVMTCFHFGMQ